MLAGGKWRATSVKKVRDQSSTGRVDSVPLSQNLAEYFQCISKSNNRSSSGRNRELEREEDARARLRSLLDYSLYPGESAADKDASTHRGEKKVIAQREFETRGERMDLRFLCTYIPPQARAHAGVDGSRCQHPPPSRI